MPTYRKRTRRTQRYAIPPVLDEVCWPRAQKLITEASQRQAAARAENAEEGGRPVSLTQAALLDRVITAEQVQSWLERAGRLKRECGMCEALFDGDPLSCVSCGASLVLDEAPRLTAVEILSARSNEDLALRFDPALSRSAPLERYEPLGELGRGGYGTVLRVRDKHLERVCALKVFRSRGRKPREVARFQREAEAMAQLRHPYIVQVYNIGRHGDVIFIAMEEIEGSSLKELLDFPLEVDRKLDIFECVLEAVGAAHAAGVLHRDIKPSNILVPHDSSEARLFDFGLAKILEGDEGVTAHREIVGTPFYTSPDQILRGADRVDGRSDIFSLGVLLYELLAGVRPFVAKSRAEVYRLILEDEPAPLGSHAPQLAGVYDAVLAGALAKRRADRFATAEALLEALRAARGRGAPKPAPRGGSAARRRGARRRTTAGNLRRSGDAGLLRSRVQPRRTTGASTWIWGALAMAALLAAALAFALLFASPAFGQDGASRLDDEDWVMRAFKVNTAAEDADRADAVRLFRVGLRDRHKLVRGFSLRGLEKVSDRNLQTFGGEELFEGLLINLGEREPYLAEASARLLKRFAGASAPEGSGTSGPTKRDWQRWWERQGAARIGAIPQPLGGGGVIVEAEPEARPEAAPGGLSTRDRATPAEGTETVETFLTQVRERGLEVVFVVDVTKSMTEEIATVREQVQEMIGFFMHLLDKKVRLGMVTYDNEVVQTVMLTRKLPSFARFVGELEIFNNPANRTYCEGVDRGLERALDVAQIGWTERPFKVVVILGDAPPHAADRPKSVALAKAAQAAGVTVNAVVTRPPKVVAGAEPLGPIKDMTDAGGGICVDLEDPDELITRLLTLSFGAKHEADLKRFVEAYRDVTKASATKEHRR